MRPAALAALLVCAPAAARAASAGNGASTLRQPSSARAAALGGALEAEGGGLDSLGINPAGAAAAKRPELAASAMSGIADDQFGFLGYAHPLKAGVAFAGLAYYDAGPVVVADLNGAQQTVAAERDYVGMFGWAMPLGGGFSVGALGKAYKFTLAQSASATGFAADAGARWDSPLPGVSLGAAVQNLGPGVKYETASDPLPLTARGGLAWTLESRPHGQVEDVRSYYTGTRMTLSADALKVRDEDLAGALSGEFAVDMGPQTAIALRVSNLFGPAAGGLSFGIGVREGRFTADYAVVSKGELGYAQDVTVGVRF
jgi:hypothetical protein